LLVKLSTDDSHHRQAAQPTTPTSSQKCRSARGRTRWLGLLGKELPAAADLMGLHRHNWLEAQILRNEARARLSLGGAAR
jgi:hypothetical protein